MEMVQLQTGALGQDLAHKVCSGSSKNPVGSIQWGSSRVSHLAEGEGREKINPGAQLLGSKNEKPSQLLG